MLKTIYFREILESLVSRKFLLVSLLCCTLVPLSVLVNQSAVSQTMAQQERSRAEYQRSLEGSAPDDQVEVKAFRPPSALSGLAAGLDPVMPGVVGIRQSGLSYGLTQSLDNPVATLFGRIDLLFIVRFVLSLVAVILSFNLICGEKETGTLKLALSNSIPRDSILIGKLLSALSLLLAPLIVALLGSLFVLQLKGDRATAGGEQWAMIGGIFLVSALYLAAFVNLGALVSSLTSRSLTAIAALLFLWASLVAIIPQCGGLLAALVYPVESAESFLLKKSLIAQDLEKQRAAELSQYFGREDYERLRAPIASKYAGKLQSVHAMLDRDYQNSRQTQLKIASAIASISPVAPMTFAFTELSGSGVSEMRRFNERLALFRSEINQRFFEGTYRDLAPGRGGQMRISTVALNELPQFNYERRRPAEVFQSVLGSVLLLAGFNLVFFVGAYLRFRKYDVR